MSKKILLLIVQGVVLCVFLFFSSVQATTPGLSGAGSQVTAVDEIQIGSPDTSGKPGEWLQGIVNRAANYLLVIGSAIAVLIILAGAYMIFSSGGVPESVAKGKAAILWAVIGLAALLFVKVIVSIIRYILEF